MLFPLINLGSCLYGVPHLRFERFLSASRWPPALSSAARSHLAFVGEAVRGRSLAIGPEGFWLGAARFHCGQ